MRRGRLDAWELFRPPTLEDAPADFCAEWAHRGCGGRPVPDAGKGEVKCSACGAASPWLGPLGRALAGSGGYERRKQ